MTKETWKFILQLIISILSAILTTLGITSCMGALHTPCSERKEMTSISLSRKESLPDIQTAGIFAFLHFCIFAFELRSSLLSLGQIQTSLFGSRLIAAFCI